MADDLFAGFAESEPSAPQANDLFAGFATPPPPSWPERVGAELKQRLSSASSALSSAGSALKPPMSREALRAKVGQSVAGPLRDMGEALLGKQYVTKELPSTYENAAGMTAEGLRRMGSALMPPLSQKALRAEVGRPGALEALRGAGETAVGMLGQVTSPITAAAEQGAQPIAQVTGIPKGVIAAGLEFATPGAGLWQRAAKTGTKIAPEDIAKVHEYVDSLYAHPAVANVEFDPAILKRAGSYVRAQLTKVGTVPEDAPSVYGRIRDYLTGAKPEGPVTTQQFRSLRTSLNDLANETAQGNPAKLTPQATVARRTQHIIDDFLADPLMTGPHTLQGDPMGAAAILQEARRAYAPLMQAERFGYASRLAELRNATTARGEREGALRRMALREYQQPEYMPADQAALKAIAEGTRARNTLREAGQTGWRELVPAAVMSHGQSLIPQVLAASALRRQGVKLTEREIDALEQQMLRRAGAPMGLESTRSPRFGIPYGVVGGLPNELPRADGGPVPDVEDYEERLSGALPRYKGLERVIGRYVDRLAGLPGRAFASSEAMRTNREYDPRPFMEASRFGLRGLGR